MKEDHKKKKISPTDKRHSGDVYMMYAPDGRVNGISSDTLVYHTFEEFMKAGLYWRKKNTPPLYTNDFLVHYHFDDAAKIPVRISGEKGKEYLERLQTVINQPGLKSEETYRIYQLMYCEEKGLNPYLQKNAPQELQKSQEYQRAVWRYSNFGEALEQTAYHGIQTDKGVLLFDNTIKGEELQQEYIDFHIHHFFDPRLEVSSLQKIDVILNDEQKTRVNPDLSAITDEKPQPFGLIADSSYTRIEDIPVSVIKESYDMSPIRKNLDALSGADKGELITLPDKTYDIVWLMWLSDKDCVKPEVQDEYPNLFSYHERFEPLGEKYDDTKTEQEKAKVMDEVRVLAKQILKSDFPDIRKPVSLKVENGKQANINKEDKPDSLKKVESSPNKQPLNPKKKGGFKL